MIVLKDFILFLVKPNFENQLELGSIYHFLKMIWKSFLVILLIDAIFFLAISTPLKFFNLLPTSRELDLNHYQIFKISLLLPVIEELIFRLPLKISRINLVVSLTIIVFLIVNKINTYASVLISILLFGFMLLMLKRESKFMNMADIFYSKYFYQIFYFQALLFGFLHLMNYNLDIRLFYLFPIFVINYILTGCYLGYVRVRYNYGIYLCIATHIAINSIYCMIHY